FSSRRRHTRFSRDWSSDVCSSDLVHLVAIADLSPSAARSNLARVGWDEQQLQADTAQTALRTGATWITDDWEALVKLPEIDIVRSEERRVGRGRNSR